MGWLTELYRRAVYLLRRRQFDRDLEEEMRFHLECRQTDGMDPAQARRQFGNVTWLREESREMWGWGWLERFSHDVRYAARALRKNHAFTLVALSTLALGIGANTTIYTVVRAVLLAPLPYRDPQRLVRLHSARFGFMSFPDLEDFRSQCASFADLAITGFSASDLVAAGEPEHVAGARASANLFSVLGVAPLLGRTFEPAEPGVVVIGYELWQRRFGGRPDAIGQTITLGTTSRAIVGVMPQQFRYPARTTEYWIPLVRDPASSRRDTRMFDAIARLQPGATLHQAQIELHNTMLQLRRAYPATNARADVDAEFLTDATVGRVRSALLILFGAVGVVLLVACANVANLLLSRGAQRKHELAVRAALGAGRARLVRLLLAESLMLAAGGGLLGILLARWSLRALATLYPPELPRVAEIAMNAPVLLFTLLVSLAAAGVAGLLPALRVSRADLGLRPRASRTGKLRAALTIAQVALAMVLLTCAGLLVRSFLIRTHVSGFNPERVVVAELSFSSRLSPGRLDEILARLRTLPGVTAATAATSFSYSRMMTLPVEAVGQPAAGAPLQPSLQAVTPQYFQVLDLPVLQGRALVETDRASSPLVAVISANMAERAFGDVPPLGRKIRFFRQEWTVVGVAADVPKFGADPDPVVYVPAAQEPDLEARTLGVRTAGPPQNAFPAVRSIIRAMEPRLPILHLQTMREDMAEMVASQRFYTLLLGVFAAFALGLAVMGVYGVVSFMVSLRTHEIGVRMALGASSVHVLRSVLREGAVLALAGIVLGTAASIAAARLLLSTTLLYKVKPSDPLTFAVVPAVLLLAALAASGLPARRAARVDPVVALKWE